ncbi:MAG: hypothetical protein LBG67_04910 [Campylobacteraceae bacterium]|jgi:hypothetical protein|nr:hypothetical protein [Campylobacteraceae bacterium]
MKNLHKLFILPFLLFVLSGCTRQHQISLVDFNSNEVLVGTFNESNSSVVITMIDGEILSGNYSSIDSEGAFTFANSFGFSSGRYRSGRFGGVGIGLNFSAYSTKYALLTSQTSELKMEILMTIKSWTDSGFGEAKTNDGRVYKIQF